MNLSATALRRNALVAVALALASAFFFTFTYVFNRVAAQEAGHWAWIASLRYLLTLPMLLPLMRGGNAVAPVLTAVRHRPWAWLKCSAICFVAFYLFLAYASDSGPAWLIAGSFQFTVVAGMLCAPFIYNAARARIPRAAMAVACLILVGVFMMQWSHANGTMTAAAWFAMLCVLISAVLYPLGNRLLLLHLERTGESLNAVQRVFGMSLVGFPIWLCVAGYAYWQSGWPGWHQVALGAGVALFSGVIATILFFSATGRVRRQPVALAAAEAMQAAELVFAAAMGALFLRDALPAPLAMVGGVFVVIGIVWMAVLASRDATGVN